MNTTELEVKTRPEKQIQVRTGFEPLNSAIPMQPSANWANKPTGLRSFFLKKYRKLNGTLSIIRVTV